MRAQEVTIAREVPIDTLEVLLEQDDLGVEDLSDIIAIESALAKCLN